jgi:hypothetical protein
MKPGRRVGLGAAIAAVLSLEGIAKYTPIETGRLLTPIV